MTPREIGLPEQGGRLMVQATVSVRRYLKFLLPASASALACLIGSAQAYRMMSWQEYTSHANEYKFPYFRKIHPRGGGLLYYYGSEHSRDPQDPQFAEIEHLWNRLHPQFAFYEGPALRIGQATKERAIKDYGESGLVIFLARHDKIPVRSLDPTLKTEMAALQHKYNAGQLKIFYVIRQKIEHDRSKKYNPTLPPLEKYLDLFIKNELRPLKAPPYSITDVQSIYAKYFPGKGEYKDADYDFVSPVPSSTFHQTIFNRISRASSDYRDRVMLARISRAACERKRVFAVVGGSHVVMQEPALREILKKCP